MNTDITGPPLIDWQVVRGALEDIRQARPMRPGPLFRLVWVSQQLPDYAPVASRRGFEMALTGILTDLILDNLTRQRQMESLAPPNPNSTREEAEAALWEDYHSRNPRLRAWSLLYARYVHLELGLQVNELTSLLQTYRRDINRRMRHGYVLLTEALSRHETAARHADRAAWLRLKLPTQTAPALYGVEQPFGTLLAALQQAGGPQVVTLTGPGGVGKTALACGVCQTLIDSETVNEIAWVALREPTAFTTLLTRIAQELGHFHLLQQPIHELEATLRIQLRETQPVLVIDNARFIHDQPATLARITRLLSRGSVLLISRERPNTLTPPTVITLNPPPFEAFWRILQDTAERTASHPLTQAQAQQIHEVVGGLPLAGQAVAAQLDSMSLDGILGTLADLPAPSGEPLLAMIFEPAWQTLSEETRRAAFAIYVLPRDGATIDGIAELLDEQTAQVERSLVPLARCGLALAPGDGWVTMPDLARQFVAGKRDTSTPYRQIVESQAQTLLQSTRTNPDDALQAALLLRSELSPGEPVDLLAEMVIQVAPAIRQTGQWLLWRDVLTFLLHYELPAAQRPLLLTELGVAEKWLGSMQQAEEHLAAAVEEAGVLGAFLVQGKTSLELGQLYAMLGRTEDAYAFYQRAASVAQRYGAEELRRRALEGLLNLSLQVNRPDIAEELLAQSLANNTEPDGITLVAQGAVAAANDDQRTAVEYFNYALELFRLEGDLPQEGRTHLRLGVAYARLEDHRRAEMSLLQGLALMRSLSDAFGQARLLTNLGVVYASQDEPDRALSMWRQAAALQAETGDETALAYTLYNLADLGWHMDSLPTPEVNRLMVEAYTIAQRYQLIALRDVIRGHPAFYAR